MKILIIEDDENKRNQISHFVREEIAGVEISVAKSYQSGLKAIIADGQDVILLDMTMPTFDIGVDEDGGRPRTFAGREILHQMERRKITVPIIIVTQFDRFGEARDELTFAELNDELRRDHSANYLEMIYYNASLADWKEPLLNAIKSLAKTSETK